MNKPILIEPGVSYWLNNVLNKSRKFREKNINLMFNISMSCLFIISISGFLIYKYKGRLSADEIQEKNKIKKTYILSKLQKLAAIRKTKMNDNMITDLPTIQSPELDLLMSNKYNKL